MVQKWKLNLNWRKFRFNLRKKMCLVQASFLQRDRRRMKKTKRFGSAQKWGFERRGEGSSGIQSQEGQELTAAAPVSSLITENSSEHHILDVTNKVMVNRYLRVFTMFYTEWWTTGLHLWHTCPSRYLSSWISEDTCKDVCAAQKHNEFERQGSFSGLLQDTVRTHFVRPLGR